MAKKVLNYMWLERDRPVEREVRQILNDDLRACLTKAAQSDKRSDIEVILWVDKEMHASEELDQLDTFLEPLNVVRRDLNDIPEFKEEGKEKPFYQDRDYKDFGTPKSYGLLIWRKIDCAKQLLILNSIEEGAEEAVYCDINIINPYNAFERTAEGEMLVGMDTASTGTFYENQVFGTHKDRSSIMRGLYEQILNEVKAGEGGYRALSKAIRVDGNPITPLVKAALGEVIFFKDDRAATFECSKPKGEVLDSSVNGDGPIVSRPNSPDKE